MKSSLSESPYGHCCCCHHHRWSSLNWLPPPNWPTQHSWTKKVTPKVYNLQLRQAGSSLFLLFRQPESNMAAPIVLSALPCSKCLNYGFLLTFHACCACGFDADKHPCSLFRVRCRSTFWSCWQFWEILHTVQDKSWFRHGEWNWNVSFGLHALVPNIHNACSKIWIQWRPSTV